MKSINQVTIINIFSTFLLQGIVFLTTPIFTRLLGTEQYGLYSVINAWISISACIMGVGTASTLGTGMYRFKEEYFKYRSSVLLLGTVISLMIVIVLLIFINPLSVWSGYSRIVILFIFIAAFTHYVISFYQNSCIYEKRPINNLIISLSLSVTSIALSIILIRNLPEKYGYIGRIGGITIPYIIVAVIVWFLIFLKEPTSIKSEYGKYALIVGFPIVFNTLAQNILSQSDRVMMQTMNISNSSIGIYSLFYSLSMVLCTVLNSLNTSWCPFYYEDIDKKEWKKLKVKSKNYIELFTSGTFAFLMISREVAYIMADESYWVGINILPVLVLSVYFTFMYQFPVNFEFFYGKTLIIAIGTIASGILNLGLNALMIPKWGMYGAAWATTISYAALFVMHYFFVIYMTKNTFFLKMSFFVPGIVVYSLGFVLFYELKEIWLFRWGMSFLIGIFELYRMWKRKSIF